LNRKRIGIVGARGHTGAELIRLLDAHEGVELAFVASRELADQRVGDHVPAHSGDLCFERMDAEAVAARQADVVVLALPNGASTTFVSALEARSPDAAILDLSADHRFDERWYYGLPELTRHRFAGQGRISNPGCYATAMQLAIAPLADRLAGPPQCFGVSGHSGAGSTPSDRNDADKLRDNLMPYALVGHLHEREVAHQLGVAVEFMPHVAPHFRGISMTVNLHLRQSMHRDEVVHHYRDFYANEALLQVFEEAPWVSRVAGHHHVALGGFALAADGKRVVIVAALDNLLKGAATQALQNLNRLLGFEELCGIPLRQETTEAIA
jgi:N-acetyl-gamma-glutamyl-phosphate reductase